MTLDHVDERTGPVVVPGAPLQTQRFVEANGDGGDVLGRPRRLHEPVRETHAQQVQHGGPAEEVIDAEHLPFGHESLQHLVELARAGLVVAERLLQREDRARRKSLRLQRAAGGCRDLRRHGEVQHDAALVHRRQRLQDRPQPARGRRVGADVGGRSDRAGERALGIRRLERAPHGRAPLRVGTLAAAGSDEVHAALGLREQQLAECGQQQARGEIAARADDHEHRLVGHERHTNPRACRGEWGRLRESHRCHLRSRTTRC